MVVIGIDPGLTGAAAAIDVRGGVRIFDLPTRPMDWAGIGDRRIDCRDLIRGMRELWPAGEPIKVAIEKVGIMGAGKNAIQTVGSLCGTACLILGALDVLGITPVPVATQAWKAHYGLVRNADEKDAAWKARHREMALRLYPDAPITLAKHHNRAEALLIAHYVRGIVL